MRKAFILPLLLVLLINNSDAKKQTSIEGIRYATYKSYTRVVIDVNGPLDFTQNRLSNPDRIYFDLKDCAIFGEKKFAVNIEDNVLKEVRMARFDKNTVRVVFGIKKTKNYYAFVLENPYRLVVDIYAPVKQTPPRKKNDNNKKVSVGKSLYEIKTVVIDAGHGGRDPGAIGPKGLKEKDITLNVAKRLGKILKEKNGIEVIYTRDRDKFVPLNERTELANAKKAELFISIHTNASKRKNTRGLETYFLNWTNDKEAIKVAARENKVSVKKMQKMQNELQFILQDLARDNKREESMRLAHSVQNSMVTSLKKKYSRIKDLGVKYALFYVLVGAEMPSILVEVSFVSNHEEERRLSTEQYKNRIAEAIAQGINSYITQASLIVNPVMDQKENILAEDVSVPDDTLRSRYDQYNYILSDSHLVIRDKM